MSNLLDWRKLWLFQSYSNILDLNVSWSDSNNKIWFKKKFDELTKKSSNNFLIQEQYVSMPYDCQIS